MSDWPEGWFRDDRGRPRPREEDPDAAQQRSGGQPPRAYGDPRQPPRRAASSPPRRAAAPDARSAPSRTASPYRAQGAAAAPPRHSAAQPTRQLSQPGGWQEQPRTAVLPRRPTGPPPGGRPPTARVPRRRPSGSRRALRIVGIVLLVLVLLVAGLALWVNSSLQRVDALTDYEGRPAATPGQTWLLVGSDSREDLSAEESAELGTGEVAGRRTDTIMLLHVPGFGGAPTLISLPRDSYVEIPRVGENKLNAAFALGGAPLLVRTVEQATGVRMDHYVEIGFDGFVHVVDAVGSVTLCPEQAIEDEMAGLSVAAGCQEMDGPTALAYVRARNFDPRGDLGRVERQQEFMSALMSKAVSPATLLNPFRMLPLTTASLDALTVDQDTGVIDLTWFALAMRKIARGDGVTTTVPIADTDFRPGGIGSTLLWDEDGAQQLFDLIRANEPVPQPELPPG